MGQIDRVTEAMRSIVATAKQQRSPSGYFAAMYLGVTRVVKDGLEQHRFTTPDRLSDLTAVFAQRYVDAWHVYQAGDEPTASWDVVFRGADLWRPTVLQHLLLGMNAHINLDLGIASAEVGPGDAIHDLRPDFEEINSVLAGLIQIIQGHLNAISPLYRFVDDVTGTADQAVINFSIARARAEAWKLATFLAAAAPAAAQQRIAEHDRVVAALGATILRPGPVLSTGLLAVRVTEKRNPAAIIDALSDAVT